MKKRNFQNQSGSIAIEFAIIFPILLLLALGLLDYGIYFFKEQTVQRGVSNLVNSAQLNPNDPNLQVTALDSTLGMINFNSGTNYFCAKSYKSEAIAKRKLCKKGSFKTSPPPTLNADGSYFVATVASANSNPIISFMSNLMPQKIVSKSVFKVNTKIIADVENTTVDNCNNGKILTTNSSGKLVCRNLDISVGIPTTSMDTKSFTCPNDTVMCGFDCTGDCDTGNMKARCCSISLSN